MLPFIRISLLILTGFIIQACDFRPLLVSSTTTSIPQPIRLEMSGLSGYNAYKFEQELRKHLSQIPKASPKTYILQINLKEVQSDITFGRDATVLRSEIDMEASYKLSQEGSDKILQYNTLWGSSSYSIHNDDEYLSVTARQSAQKRSTLVLAEDLAREINFFIHSYSK